MKNTKNTPTRADAQEAYRVLCNYAGVMRAHHNTLDALETVERDLQLTNWTVKIGDYVRALDDVDEVSTYTGWKDAEGQQYIGFHHVPGGTVGRVIDLTGESPDDDDSELLVSFRWIRNGVKVSGLAGLNHEKWVERLPKRPTPETFRR